MPELVPRDRLARRHLHAEIPVAVGLDHHLGAIEPRAHPRAPHRTTPESAARSSGTPRPRSCRRYAARKPGRSRKSVPPSRSRGRAAAPCRACRAPCAPGALASAGRHVRRGPDPKGPSVRPPRPKPTAQRGTPRRRRESRAGGHRGSPCPGSSRRPPECLAPPALPEPTARHRAGGFLWRAIRGSVGHGAAFHLRKSPQG